MTRSTCCDLIHCFNAEFVVGCIAFKACKDGLHSIKLIGKDEIVVTPNGSVATDDKFGAIKWFEDYCRGIVPTHLPKLCYKEISKLYGS